MQRTSLSPAACLRIIQDLYKGIRESCSGQKIFQAICKTVYCLRARSLSGPAYIFRLPIKIHRRRLANRTFFANIYRNKDIFQALIEGRGDLGSLSLSSSSFSLSLVLLLVLLLLSFSSCLRACKQVCAMHRVRKYTAMGQAADNAIIRCRCDAAY